MTTTRGVVAVALSCLLNPTQPIWLGEVMFVLVLLDFFLGSIRAIIGQDWKLYRFSQGARKVAWWGLMIILASFLSAGIGQEFDWLLKRLGVLLVFFIVVTELTSVLQNMAGIALLLGIEVPWLKELIDLFERWGATEENHIDNEVRNNGIHGGGQHDSRTGGHDGNGSGGDEDSHRPDPPARG